MAKPDCAICKGLGWRVFTRDGIEVADRCPCVAETAASGLEAQAQIPANYAAASFENFRLPQDNPVSQKGLADVMLAVSSYTRSYPNVAKPGLLLVGPPGTGKTHLAVAALRILISHGHGGIFFDYQNLLERIRSSYNETLGAANRDTFQSAHDSDILVLDDLGAHRVTDWVEDTVTSLITHRYNHRKTLIATTNLTDPEITGSLVEKASVAAGGHSYKITLEERIGERARSRLFEMCRLIRMPNVEDYRIKRMK